MLRYGEGNCSFCRSKEHANERHTLDLTCFRDRMWKEQQTRCRRCLAPHLCVSSKDRRASQVCIGRDFNAFIDVLSARPLFENHDSPSSQLECDLVHIDGGRFQGMPLKDLQLLHRHSREGSVVVSVHSPQLPFF